MVKTRRTSKRTVVSKRDRPIAITPVEYGGLQKAFDHFNRELFGGQLPDVFIDYQRHAHSRGHYAHERFAGRSVGQPGRSELALNPDTFIDRTDEQIVSTLVHEMVHVWQYAAGSPSKRGYHNKEWAAKMKSIGLQPSSTGAVGGKETGQRVSHYILPDGPFTKLYAKLAATGWHLNLQSAPRSGAKGGVNSKTKFTCSTCGQNVWGKPDTAVTCSVCLIRAFADRMGASDAAPIVAWVEQQQMREPSDNTIQPYD